VHWKNVFIPLNPSFALTKKNPGSDAKKTLKPGTRPEFRTPEPAKPKKIRIEDSAQPKLQFFWKEGSEMKGSVPGKPDGRIRDSPGPHRDPESRIRASISLVDLPQVESDSYEARTVWADDPELPEAALQRPDRPTSRNPTMFVSTEESLSRRREETTFTNLSDLGIDFQEGDRPETWARGNLIKGGGKGYLFRAKFARGCKYRPPLMFLL
jgi:hypothetical protein